MPDPEKQLNPLEEKRTQDLQDKRTAGFLKIAYSWLSELLKSCTEEIVKVLSKDVFRIHIENPSKEPDLSKIEKSLSEIASKETIVKVDAPDLEFLKSIKKIEGIDGEKGDKGDKPTKEELIILIRPLIPEPVKGEKGEDADENIIIKKLVPLVLKRIPTPKDGKDAEIDEKKIIENVIKKIPKSKDGKSVTTKEVIEAIKKLQNIFEVSHIKGLEQRLQVGLRAGKQRMYGVGPSGALRSVAHDSSITGDGTAESPLGAVAAGGAPTIETPAGDINGVNTAYTITAATTHIILLNGIELEEGVGNDYTISGTTLTMLYAPETGSKLRHRYWI